MDTKNKEIIVQGIITKEMDFREYDKNLTIVTKELGKIYVVSFGARRQKSINISKTSPFICGEFELKVVGGKYNLNSVKVLNDFHELSLDIEKFNLAADFLKILEHFTMENVGAGDYLNLIYMALISLVKGKIPMALVEAIYKLKCLQYAGLALPSDMLPVISTLAYTWSYILSHDNPKLFSFTLNDDILKLLINKVNKEFEEKS